MIARPMLYFTTTDTKRDKWIENDKGIENDLSEKMKEVWSAYLNVYHGNNVVLFEWFMHQLIMN